MVKCYQRGCVIGPTRRAELENEQVEKRIDMMRELLKTMVDVQNLKQSKELRNSIQDEVKRQSVDAAKKRAAAQNVDYACFANLTSDCGSPATRSQCEKYTTELRTNASVSKPGEEIIQEQHQVLNLPPHVRVMDGKEQVVSWVASVMEALTSCGRFGLAVKLMGQESRDAAREIIKHISSASDEPEKSFALTFGARSSNLLHRYSCI
ncbi:hypothetical protein Mapa_014907 [Marchantia paleacea]|nr:hypothetical protein Mapa_014907 [Marchantia paleacea]